MMTLREVMAHEQAVVGRKCSVVHWVIIDGTRFVVFDVEGIPLSDDLEKMYSRRWVVVTPNGQFTGGIVSSEIK